MKSEVHVKVGFVHQEIANQQFVMLSVLINGDGLHSGVLESSAFLRRKKLFHYCTV
jgi:hypothetical protein